MKILWVHNFNPNTYGSGVWMKEFFIQMKDSGIDINSYYTGNLRSFSSLIYQKKYIKKISENYDIVHAQFGSACSYAVSEVTQPKIVSLRGSDWHKYFGRNVYHSAHSFLAKLFTNLSIGKFDSIITMSEKMTMEVAKSFHNIPIYTLPDPIDTNLFTPIDKMYSRKSYFNSTSRIPWILFTTISKDNPIKRIELGIEAVSIAKSMIGDIELKIANGIQRCDMPKFISACDLALCTSTHEGWPNSIKEALACGLPFVSTDVSDLAIIANKYSTCHISSPQPEVIADHICNSISMMKSSSYSKIELHNEIEVMSMHNTCIRLLTIYKDLLDNRQ